ncbi:MAG: adenylate/guanylate cyclase domain-containing protein [Myxococcota bacterium]|nr:adenylate/guanylate cyclase domain-containing protein [Myxococcota bacterium]
MGDRDADNPLKSAKQMMAGRQEFNRHRRLEGKAPIQMGVGVSTGEVVSSNMGSSKRMNYTVIGDAVN